MQSKAKLQVKLILGLNLVCRIKAFDLSKVSESMQFDFYVSTVQTSAFTLFAIKSRAVLLKLLAARGIRKCSATSKTNKTCLIQTLQI